MEQEQVINLSKLGLTQRRLLKEMCNDKIIRVVKDYRDFSEEISLSDVEGENDFEKVNKIILQRLIDRGLIYSSTFTPSLEIEITTFFVKRAVKLRYDAGML